MKLPITYQYIEHDGDFFYDADGKQISSDEIVKFINGAMQPEAGSALERRVIDAALERLKTWEEEFPDGFDEKRPMSDVARDLIQATKALRDSRRPQLSTPSEDK